MRHTQKHTQTFFTHTSFNEKQHWLSLGDVSQKRYHLPMTSFQYILTVDLNDKIVGTETFMERRGNDFSDELALRVMVINSKSKAGRSLEYLDSQTTWTGSKNFLRSDLRIVLLFAQLKEPGREASRTLARISSKRISWSCATTLKQCGRFTREGDSEIVV